MKKAALITALTIFINIAAGISVFAGSIIFCDIDFEDTSSPFGGMVCYSKDNIITVEGDASNRYAAIKKLNGNDCHIDYTIGLTVDKLIAEADFSFNEVSSEINPFYFIGSAGDGKTRCDLDLLYVRPDMGLYLAEPGGCIKLCILEKGTVYRISVAIKLDERLAEVYVNGTKLGSRKITLEDFQAIKAVRTWVRNDAGNTLFNMDNYRVYEADAPLEKLPDVWESVFPDDGKERISAEEIRTIFSSEARMYPRLFAEKSDFERIKMSSDKAVWYRKVRNLLSEPVVEYELTDGYRLLEISRTVLKRMELWGFMYQMTGDDKYYIRAWKELEAICGFKDWHPEHFLDTAEMMTAAAIGYDWFYECMTEEQKELLSGQIIEKGLKPTRLAYYGRLTTGGVAGPSMNFVTSPDNMNIVDNCSAIIAATVVFEKDPDICSDIIEKAVRSLDYPLKNFAPDGAWEEGINYWIYAAEYLSRAMCALDMTFGSDLGIASYEGLENTARWAVSLDSYYGVNSYHDTWDGMHMDTFALSGLGRKYTDNAILEYREHTVTQMDYMPTVYDILWCDPIDGRETLANENYTKTAESISIRAGMFNDDGTINTTGLFFSTHGGRNDSYHSHLDAGAFVFDIDGERWALDIPPEDYNNMIGTDGNNYYRKRAEGHNTIVINPSLLGGQIADASSWVCDYFFGENDAYAVYDMSQIYSDSVSAYKRGFYVGDNRRSLTIRDEMTLSGSSDIYWFMHTRADIEPAANGAVLTLNGKKLRLEAKSNCSLEIIKMDAEPLSTSPDPDNQTSNTGINKVAIKLSGSGSVTLEVKLSPYTEDISKPSDSPISSWRKLAKSNSECTVYDFEDYTGGIPEGFSELNRDDVTSIKLYDNAFGETGRSLWVAQAKTTSSGSHEWYQLRATVKPVEKRYQHVHFEQAYDNQFSDRWLLLKFNDNIETSVPLFSFSREAADMSPLFEVCGRSYGIQPVSLMGWNSYDIIIDLSEKSYDMYVNGVQMADGVKLMLKSDAALTALHELQFGLNHQWDSLQSAYAATSTYMDNITVTPLDAEPYFKKVEMRYFREGIACEPRYADMVVFAPQSGTAIMACYDSGGALTDIKMANGEELNMEVCDGMTVGMFNWESVASMKPLSEAVVFTIEHFKGIHIKAR